MNMKRVILFAFALLTIGSAFAQTVSVNDVYVRPGETAQFAVSLSGDKANTYTAMTLYVQFPATGFTTTGAYTISSSWLGASTTVGDVDKTGLATIPFASPNAIPGSSVDNLVSISFAVGSNVDYGDYDVTLKGTMFEYNTSDKDYADDVTFTVHVTDKVVLDENSPFAPIAYDSNQDIIVKRTIKANEWSTICFPFPLPVAKLKAAIGDDDCQLMAFAGYEAEKDGDCVVGLKLNFTEVSVGALAHTPLLIKTSRNVSEFEMTNTKLTTNNNPSTISTQLDYTTFEEVEIARMQGTYQAGTIVPANSLFISGNKFYYSAGKTKMKAFRAYFTLQDVLTDVANASRITLSFDDSETAGIKTVDKKNSDKYYNLRGQQVETPAKGVYVKDGKKVIIK